MRHKIPLLWFDFFFSFQISHLHMKSKLTVQKISNYRHNKSLCPIGGYSKIGESSLVYILVAVLSSHFWLNLTRNSWFSQAFPVTLAKDFLIIFSSMLSQSRCKISSLYSWLKRRWDKMKILGLSLMGVRRGQMKSGTMKLRKFTRNGWKPWELVMMGKWDG